MPLRPQQWQANKLRTGELRKHNMKMGANIYNSPAGRRRGRVTVCSVRNCTRPAPAMMRLHILLLSSLVATCAHQQPSSASDDGPDWSAFLARSDPINRFTTAEPLTLPDEWLEAAFTGNAMLGTQVLVCPGGICRQSLLTGSNSSRPPAGKPLQVVLPVARGDVSDIRAGNESVVCTEWHSKITCAGSPIWSQPKLGIGALVLRPTRGAIIGGAIRTHLHNATISVLLNTTLGSVSFRVYVHAQRQLLVIDELSGSGGEAGQPLHWDFRPAPALPPGLFSELKDPATNFTRFVGATPPSSYTPNPDPVCSGSHTTGRCEQSLLASPEGRGWVTAWRAEADRGGGGVEKLLLTITSDIPVRVGIKPKAVRAADEATSVLSLAAASLGTLAAEHARWWQDFYWSDASGSFISLPAAGAQIEQFHWIQAFKIGAENACRRFVDSAFEAGVLDNCMLLDGLNFIGPMQKTKYPHAIWDLNVEAAQYGSLSANYVEQTLALTRRVPEQLNNMIVSVPPDLRNDSASIYMNTASFSFLNEAAIDRCDFPLCSDSNVSAVPDLPKLTRPCSAENKDALSCYFGGLPWVCHGIWLVYRHTMDEGILRALMPVLKRATALYLHTAVHNSTDGKLHLPMTFSPEYATLADCTFDLALFRWCLQTSIHIGSALLPGSASLDELTSWRVALQQLAPPQVDPKTGSLMIGEGVPLHSGLKMWSHIFSVFPLGQLDWHASPKDRELWTKSLELFKFFNNPERCSSPSCVDGESSPAGTVQSREGFAYLSMGLLTMLTKPSLPGGAPADWADWGLGNVTERFFKPLHVPQLGAGTMYADHAACGPVPGCREGMAGPCNESPIMASLALQQMLLQSWNGRPIAVFPAVPASWKHARFARMRAEGAVLIDAVRDNFTTIFVALNATIGGNVSVHTTITDLVSSNAEVTVNPSVTPSGEAAAAGIFDLSVNHGQPWAAVLYSKARGPPSAEELGLARTPLPPGASNLWGSRAPGNWTPPSPPPAPPSPSPSPPAPAPLPPLPPCNPTGCAGCGGCKWPYANATLPEPKQPVSGSLAGATTLACEAKCGAMADCAGFTRKHAEKDCYFYSKAQVSGLFSHTRPDVSWHPNPQSGLPLQFQLQLGKD